LETVDVSTPVPLIIACGALATDLKVGLHAAALTSEDLEIRYLSVNLHNTPQRIVPELEALLEAESGRPILVGYADCGTGGGLDRLLERFPNAERLAGAHCYDVFAGEDHIAALQDDQPGTFYLTDFLARNFESLVWRGLGLDKHPSLKDMYFGHYTRVVLLAQDDNDPKVLQSAEAAAERLGLAFEVHPVGRHRLMKSVVSVIPVEIAE